MLVWSRNMLRVFFSWIMSPYDVKEVVVESYFVLALEGLFASRLLEYSVKTLGCISTRTRHN